MSIDRKPPDPARPDTAIGPIPLALLREVQQTIAQASAPKPGAKRFDSPNEVSGYFYRTPKGAIAYTFGIGGDSQGVVEQPPATAIAQYHSHPPKFGSDLGGALNLNFNFASFGESGRPGDVQRWIGPNGIRERGILHAYVFGPTQVSYYDLAKLTGAKYDERNFCVAALTGADVAWPFLNDYEGAAIA